MISLLNFRRLILIRKLFEAFSSFLNTFMWKLDSAQLCGKFSKASFINSVEGGQLTKSVQIKLIWLVFWIILIIVTRVMFHELRLSAFAT